MEAAVVSGIAFSRDEAKITLLGVPDKPGIAFSILGPVAAANIDVDMIVQNQSVAGTTDFSFTVNRNEFARAVDLLKREVIPAVGARELSTDEKVAKVSIVGIGMRSHVGVASLMFQTLSQGINIQMISTSEIKTSVIIDDKYMELGARAAQGLRPGPGARRQGLRTRIRQIFVIRTRFRARSKVVLESRSLRRRAREAEGSPAKGVCG